MRKIDPSEKPPQVVTTSYGNTGYLAVDGNQYHYASAAERDFLYEVKLCLQSKQIRRWIWQPAAVAITYRHGGVDCTRTYRPDAWIQWQDGVELWYEVKHSRIDQKAANNMLQFCRNGRPLVLVWKGSFPKKGIMKRRFDQLRPHLHHVWRLI